MTDTKENNQIEEQQKVGEETENESQGEIISSDPTEKPLPEELLGE